jgi:hypothetical protein
MVEPWAGRNSYSDRGQRQPHHRILDGLPPAAAEYVAGSVM